MPIKTSARSSGKKAAPPVGVSKTRHSITGRASSAAKSRKPLGARRAAKKIKRHPAAFYTLKSRQQAVQRAKLQIWRHLPEINGAVIKLAESGSYLAARTLFDFAGVYTLPALKEETVPVIVSADSPDVPATAGQWPETVSPPVNRVEAFLKGLGLDPLSDDEPEPDLAA